MSRYEHAYGQISGLHHEPSACIALRWEANAPFRPDNGESHVLECRDGRLFVTEPIPGRLAGLWRAASGALYAAHESGLLYVRETVDDAWVTQRLTGALAGVWGLDETGDVYAWGVAPGGSAAVFYKRSKDGAFEAMAAPELPILELHGARPDLLVGVGLDGGIHLLEGGVWRRMASPTKTALASIFVVGDDEMYACGPSSKYVLEGSVRGWTRRGPFDKTLYRIAKHDDTVHVACGRSGIFTLPAGATALEVLREDSSVSHLDVREGVLTSHGEHFGEKEPGGIRFMSEPVSSYEKLAARWAPSWR